MVVATGRHERLFRVTFPESFAMRYTIAFASISITILLFVLAPASTMGQGKGKKGGSGGGGFGPDSGGPGGDGGFGRNGDPNQTFDFMAKGRGFFLSTESKRLAEPLGQFLQDKGISDGKVTRELFLAFNEQMALPGLGGSELGKALEILGRLAETDFRRLDRNRDGFLNQDEMPAELKAELSKWDTNRDNLISLDEYKPYFVATRMQARTREDQRSETADLRLKLDSALKEIRRLKDLLSPGTANTPESVQEKDKNSIQSLFDGIPADLRSNVLGNRVRRDRVNDWLQENVNGKGKPVQLHVSLHVIVPRRVDDGTYWTFLTLDDIAVKILGDNGIVRVMGANDWTSTVNPRFLGNRTSFEFEGVSAADAEKLADVKQATIQGKVMEAKLEPIIPNDSPPYCLGLILQDVQVNGKAFTPRKRETPTPAKKKGLAGPIYPGK